MRRAEPGGINGTSTMRDSVVSQLDWRQHPSQQLGQNLTVT
jgi:hypothetical protein